MFIRPGRLWALLFLALVVQLTASRHVRIMARQDGGEISTTATGSEPQRTAEVTGSNKEDSRTDDRTTETPTRSEDEATSTSTDASETPTATVGSDKPFDNSTFYDIDIPAGELPLTPKITPGWGVAGAVMLITGVIYTLVGIRNRYIHTFFSTAFLVALGIAVLIVYVMNVPVSVALQGGYVAAVIISGCVVGVASIFFKELTEGLGCALGGFCVSMWLMCLVPGGLLGSVPAKAIFIAAFTCVGFAFYFSRYTRDWAFITMISFGGATVTVLGIDCFSRAGLKEFWAYIWQLNKNLFPLGANTYPVTKGIRVETAAIIIIFLVGIISQIKLWRIVRDKRQTRAAERAEGQRTLEQEEAVVGRQVEEANARERKEWERAHGDGELGSSAASRISGDAGSEKKLAGSYGRRSEVEVIEMGDMPESDRGRDGPEPLTEKDADGKVIIRVAADDKPEGADDDTESRPTSPSIAPSGGPHRVSSSGANLQRQSRVTVGSAPAIVPLPFTVPEHRDGNDDSKSCDSRTERSSVATFADEPEDVDVKAHRRHSSLAKRLSQGSSKLLRNLSTHSAHKRNTPTAEHGESSEDLVIPHGDRDDDDSSIAATLDNQSLDDSHRRSVLDAEPSPEIEVTALLSGPEAQVDRQAGSSLSEDDKVQAQSMRPVSTEVGRASLEASSRALGGGETPTVAASRIDEPESSQNDQLDKAKSVSSGLSSRHSLTKDRLPRSLSKVALSYRTNEWAKHLSYADAPEPDELHVTEAVKLTKVKSKKERPAPVNVEELQQATEDGIPPLSSVRSDPRLSRRDSRQGISPSLSAPVGTPEQTFSPPMPPPQHSAGSGMLRASSSLMGLRKSSTNFEPIVEEHDLPPNAQDYSATPVSDNTDTRSLAASPPPESRRASVVPGVVSYSNPQTLLGQREMFLRSKSQGNLFSQTPEPQGRPSSDAGSLSNYPMYAAALAADPDDMPLSQRKQMMHRHSSMMTLSGTHQNQQQQASMAPQSVHRSSSGFDLSTGNAPFDSHQSKRNSTVPTPAARQAQLAQFRSSVAQDLRSGSPMLNNPGRETPFASTNNLLGGLSGREAEVQRNIQLQRNLLLGQKEAEAQRREMHRQKKEWNDRVFDEAMRSGELMDAHREAMRKMQSGAK
ncbi:uncharacterized protein F5Z01DRAFT_679326 [Emericellopsis atlantica]|uniref:TM7S3/TM198-like domain-containing protein n=1 Tax=Emericellopsis atlantica TaxID=2614577 RepID=A0A9P7ZTF3_9HYPO|nr:uncharacterized protein F5Z01DRAFT_679326 [Emericellopsis atlantica]KAG9258023.1 hypothetical protein F5Z01DRAFT_679326 [Emericellopsis atlantica]